MTTGTGGRQGISSAQERIFIRLDRDVIDYFLDRVDRAGGGDYQTDINNVLRDYIDWETGRSRNWRRPCGASSAKSCTPKRVPALDALDLRARDR
ncbi:MAG TPA: BrnA antitoxin family protein [Bryobacteraceae bacterium]|nr:BrnA antitoxin family protein [Bryobacteraceae bacterium]